MTDTGVFPTELEPTAKPRYKPIRTGDYILLVIAFMGMLIVGVTLPYGILCSAGVFLVCAAFYVRLRTGPVYNIVFVQPFERLERWMYNGYHYLAPDTPEADQPRTSRLKWKPITELPDLLPHLNPLKGQGEDVGVLHVPSTHTDYSYARIGNFDSASRGPADQRQTQTELSQMAKELLAISEVKVGLSALFQIRPRNIRPYMQYIMGALLPDVYYAADKAASSGILTDDDHVNLQMYNTLQEQIVAASLGNDVTAAIVVSARRPSALSRALSSNSSLDSQTVRELPIVRLQNATCRMLENMGVNGVKTMTHLDLHNLTRTSWDISDNLAEPDPDGRSTKLFDYHAWYGDLQGYEEEMREKIRAGVADPDSLEYDLPDTMWPHLPGARIIAHSDCIEFANGAGDSSWTATLVAGGMPAMSTPDAFNRLYLATPAQYLSIAYIGDVITSRREVKNLDWVIELTRVVDEVRGKMSQGTHAALREQQIRTRAMERATSGASQSGKLTVAPVCATRRELNEEMSTLAEQMRSMQLRPFRVTGSHLQLPAALSAWFAIDLL